MLGFAKDSATITLSYLYFRQMSVVFNATATTSHANTGISPINPPYNAHNATPTSTAIKDEYDKSPVDLVLTACTI